MFIISASVMRNVGTAQLVPLVLHPLEVAVELPAGSLVMSHLLGAGYLLSDSFMSLLSGLGSSLCRPLLKLRACVFMT